MVFISMIRPQSCTATKLFILTMPVSMSTETSAICAPPTPPVVSVPLPASGFLPRVVNGCDAELRAGLFPGHARWSDLADLLNLTADGFQFVRRGVHRRSDLFKQRVERVHRRAACRRTDAADGRRTARSARDRVAVVADVNFDRFNRQSRAYQPQRWPARCACRRRGPACPS